VVLKRETAWRDGATHLAMTLMEFMQWQVGWRLCGSQIREFDVGCGSKAADPARLQTGN